MSAGIEVVKMSGAGNDFIVLGPGQLESLGDAAPEWIRAVCRRGLSVGADGVLAVDALETGHVRVRFYNPDASVAFCGNGTRCAARFALDRGLAGPRMRLDTAVGGVDATVDGGRVELALPPPIDRGPLRLELPDGTTLEGRWIVAGVPHYVVGVERLDDDRLRRWGPPVRRHPAFGDEGTNLDLVHRVDVETLALRTWERGVEGETLACGSGAVAAAMAGRLAGGPSRQRLIPASGSVLTVELPGDPSAPERALLGGDARRVFRGTVDREALDR